MLRVRQQPAMMPPMSAPTMPHSSVAEAAQVLGAGELAQRAEGSR